MMIRNNNGILYISVILLVILLSIYNTCNHNKGQNSGVKTKTDTIYKVIEKNTQFNDTIIKMMYNNNYYTTKEIQNQIEEKIDTGWVSLPYNEYIYKYDTIQEHKYGQTKISAAGWGYISKIDVENKWKDTTITITKEITKYKNASGLFLSAGYQRPFDKNSPLNPLYSIGLDYQIRNKVIIGTSIGVQNNEPVYGLKLGIKIK